MDHAEALSRLKEKRKRELPRPFTARFTPDDLRFLRLAVHPTRKQKSVEVTKQILRYLDEHDCVMSMDVQKALGLSETPVLKRLNIFLQFKLLKREFNRFYIITPRLHELVRLYIEHL